MKLRLTTRRLELRHPWTIARGTATHKEYAFVELESGGVRGLGEAAHNVRYGESLDGIVDFLEGTRPLLEDAEPWRFRVVGDRVRALAPGMNAAKAAVDMALLDGWGKEAGVPLHRWLGADPGAAPATSYSIGIDSPEVVEEKVREAGDFPVLKVKLGAGDDRARIEAVRRVTDRPLRVDANEGWTDREEAAGEVEWLADRGVELVEQPLPAHRLDDVAWVRERSPLPLVADEDVTPEVRLPELTGAYDGINVKVAKVGGVLPALRLIETARHLGLRVMLGCMVESSLGITAAAHLAPLVEWADLDGALLLRDDPFRGVTYDEGRLVLPDGPGLGVEAV